LKKFALATCAQHPITKQVKKDRQSGKEYILNRICISSQKLTRALEKLGITERKSFIVKPCEEIDDRLLKHYWRGILEGDGNICYSKTNKRWQMSLVGNKAIVDGFAQFISYYAVSRAKPRKLNNNVFVIQYAGITLSRNIIKVLYDGATIYLDRKKALADQAIASFQDS
jgi:hypothetical protein